MRNLFLKNLLYCYAGGIHEAVRVSACCRLTKVLGGHLQWKDHCQVRWLVYNERGDTCQHSLVLGWLGRGPQFTMTMDAVPGLENSKTSTCLRSAILKDRLKDSLLHLFGWDTFPFWLGLDHKLLFWISGFCRVHLGGFLIFWHFKGWFPNIWKNWGIWPSSWWCPTNIRCLIEISS